MWSRRSHPSTVPAADRATVSGARWSSQPECLPVQIAVCDDLDRHPLVGLRGERDLSIDNGKRFLHFADLCCSVIATGRILRGSRSVPAGASDKRTSRGVMEAGLKATIASPEESGMYLTRRSTARRSLCLTGLLPSSPSPMLSCVPFPPPLPPPRSSPSPPPSASTSSGASTTSKGVDLVSMTRVVNVRSP